MHRVSVAVGGVIVAAVVLLWPGGSSSPAQSVTTIAPDVDNTSTTSTLVPGGATSLGGARGALVASVRASVLRAEAGTPIPVHSRPMVSPTLESQVADLGACDYGVPHENAGGRLCVRGDATAERTLVVLGDSHGRHWVPAIERIAEAHGWKAYYFVKQQCTASLVSNGDPYVADPTAPWAACTDFRRWAISAIGRLHPDVVIVSTSVPAGGVFTRQGGYTEDPTLMVHAYSSGFSALWSRLHTVTDARIVLLRDVPARLHGTSPELCLTRPRATQRDCISPERAPELLPRIHLVDAAVHAATDAGVEVVDPRRWFCWHGKCPVLIGHYLPYRNSAHITVDYSRHLAAPLAAALGL